MLRQGAELFNFNTELCVVRMYADACPNAVVALSERNRASSRFGAVPSPNGKDASHAGHIGSSDAFVPILIEHIGIQVCVRIDQFRKCHADA
jgi:hypothetical protein